MQERKSWYKDIDIKTVVSWIIMLVGFVFTIGYAKSEFDNLKSNQTDFKQVIKEYNKNINDLQIEQREQKITNENQQILLNKHELKLYP